MSRIYKENKILFFFNRDKFRQEGKGADENRSLLPKEDKVTNRWTE